MLARDFDGIVFGLRARLRLIERRALRGLHCSSGLLVLWTARWPEVLWQDRTFMIPFELRSSADWMQGLAGASGYRSVRRNPQLRLIRRSVGFESPRRHTLLNCAQIPDRTCPREG
jgi:hypothetical protein